MKTALKLRISPKDLTDTQIYKLSDIVCFFDLLYFFVSNICVWTDYIEIKINMITHIVSYFLCKKF